MMFTHKNLMTVCCAAVLAFGLAACGSSSDDDSAMMPVEPVELVDPVDPGPTPEEMTKAVGTKAKAIGEVGPDNALLADPLSVTVMAKRTGPDIKVEGDDDFTHVMGPMYSLMHDADDDGNVVEEIVLVDHTITAPKARSFESQYPLTLITAVSTDTTNDGEEGTTDDDTFEALFVGASADLAPTSEVLELVMSDAFVAGAGTTTALDFDSDNDGTAAKDDAYEASGTYDGAPGTYRCNAASGTPCTVQLTRNPKGMVSITEMSTGWIFTPDDKAKVYVVDTEYASFGIWLKRTTDEDGVLTYNMVDTFADGTTATDSVAAVTGTASYKGSALGVYVHNVLDPAGEVASATGGMFTADVALTASFAQTVDDPVTTDVMELGTIAPDQENTITGTIDNFELEGGEAQSWSVELMRSGTYDEDGNDVAFDGDTKGGGAEGDYSGRFYGATGDDNDAPSTVGGEFTANFLNGNVAGGFGATKQDD